MAWNLWQSPACENFNKNETASVLLTPLQNDLAGIAGRGHWFSPINIFYAQPNLISLLVMSRRVLFLLMSSVAVFRGEAYLQP
jgi:hypothetical protein